MYLKIFSYIMSEEDMSQFDSDVDISFSPETHSAQHQQHIDMPLNESSLHIGK